jgi:peptidyl-prolyl cis-trans isomerase C
LCLFIVVCHSCAPTAGPPTVAKHKPKAEKAVQPADKPPTEPLVEQPKIVAEVDDYVITADQLAEITLLQALPNEFDEEEGYSRQNKPVGVRQVLLGMIADKIMIIRARQQNILRDDEETRFLMDRYEHERIIELLVDTYLEGKINVTESEIDDLVKANPRFKNRDHAKRALEGEKAGILMNELYEELYEQLDVHTVGKNMVKAAKIYKRLLNESRKYGGRNYVRIRQIREDLTTNEKNMPLVVFDGGKVTLEYWFYAVTDLSPPTRPPDLDTELGVSRFLDTILGKPLFIAEAKRLGLDKDEDYIKQIREREDIYLLNTIKRRKTKHLLRNPSEQQILEYFNSHRRQYSEPDTMKIEQIWCPDLETAWKARLELDDGADFDSVGGKYAIDKKKHSREVYPGGEGMFFDELWKAETGETTGPIRGFYRRGVKWRIVKILERYEGKPAKYSEKLKKHIHNDMWFSKKEEVLDKYKKECLAKYPFKIYSENIIDPLNPP